MGEFGYIFSDQKDFGKNRRAEEDFSYNGSNYTVQEERVGSLDNPDATILRVFDEGENLEVAATYTNDLLEKSERDYDGMNDPVLGDKFDNPLHAINEITGGKLNSDLDYSQSQVSEEFDFEGIEAV